MKTPCTDTDTACGNGDHCCCLRCDGTGWVETECAQCDGRGWYVPRAIAEAGGQSLINCDACNPEMRLPAEIKRRKR